MRPFQIVLLSIFAILAIGGVVFMTIYQGAAEEQNQYGGSVEIWGTFDKKVVRSVLEDITNTDDNFSVVKYSEKDSATFDDALVHAIAEGRAPDLVLLGHDQLVMHRSKLFPLSYETMSQRTIRDTYIDGVEIFARHDGLYGIPVGVDPLVLYWNRDIFSSGGQTAPPETWEQLVSATVPALTKKNTNLDIFQSAVALGEYTNVRYAKEILSSLLLQSGSALVSEKGVGTNIAYQVTLNEQTSNGIVPAHAALSFYTQFALPSHTLYTWNRALTEDHYQFLAGELALYFAPGSAYYDLKKENPNLNFDVSEVPQGAGATIRRNYGRFYALAIPKASDNISGAFRAAWKLGQAPVLATLTEALHLAPVHRATIGGGTNDPYRDVLYTTALISRGWLDPNPIESSMIMKQMVEDITSGRSRVSGAVRDAVDRLRAQF